MSERSLYYDRQGQPIDVNAWEHLYRDRDYRNVARTQVTPDILVSTVWLGIDHSFANLGPYDANTPPVLFETMVLGGPLDETQWRYCTEVQALAGHDQVVAAVKHGEGGATSG